MAGRIYNIWYNMKHRCYNEKNEYYHDYGGRGIKVCEEWLNSYFVFRTWVLANNYQPGLRLDRKDNDGNYEPSNCQFVTQKENTNNTRRNIRIEAFGEVKTLPEWIDDPRCKVDYYTLRYRLTLSRARWSPEYALTKPAQ